MARCTGMVRVSGLASGGFQLECKVAETPNLFWTTRETAINQIAELWKKINRIAEDMDVGEPLRVQAKAAASHIMKAEMILHAPRGIGGTSCGVSSGVGEGNSTS